MQNNADWFLIVYYKALAFYQIVTCLDHASIGWEQDPDQTSALALRHPYIKIKLFHYSDVVMSAMAPQNTSLTIAYTTVYSGADQIKHKSSLGFVRGIHRSPVKSPPKGQ